MGLFGGGTKVSKAVSQSEAAGSFINGSDWTVRKSAPIVNNSAFSLAVIASAAYLYYAWRKMKKIKG